MTTKTLRYDVGDHGGIAMTGLDFSKLTKRSVRILPPSQGVFSLLCQLDPQSTPDSGTFRDSMGYLVPATPRIRPINEMDTRNRITTTSGWPLNVEAKRLAVRQIRRKPGCRCSKQEHGNVHSQRLL
jgi:hypothetical protein